MTITPSIMIIIIIIIIIFILIVLIMIERQTFDFGATGEFRSQRSFLSPKCGCKGC